MSWWIVLLLLPVWILLLVLVLIIVGLLLSALPIRYWVIAKTGEETAARAKARYLFGLLRAEYIYENGEGKLKVKCAWHEFGKRRKSAAKPEQPAQEVEQETDELPITSKVKHYYNTAISIYTKIRNYPNRPQITALFITYTKQTAIHILPRHLHITGEFGLPCPATTGQIFAAYGVAREFIKTSHNRNVHIRPNFDTEKPIYNMQINTRGHILPIYLLYLTAALAIKKPIRKLIGDLIKN